MKEVTFLERLAESLLEGSFARALKPRLQPVQIAKALAREMERSQIVGVDAPLVANRYVVQLHPDDFGVFSGFQASLERELASYLKGYAARRGLKCLAPPTVTLAPNEAVRRGRVGVEAVLVDEEPPPSPEPPAPARMPEGTVEMAASLPAAPPPADQHPAFLVDDEGRRFAIGGAVTSIGRAVDNDIVLEDGSVSRHHARIVWESGRYLLIDLDSTNGSYVSAHRVSRHALCHGDELSLGGVHLLFRLADH